MENGIKTFGIDEKNKNSLASKSISNLTTKTELESITPASGRVLIAIKTWPAQNQDGIFVPDSYTVIRNNKYIAEVIAVGENVLTYKVGHVVTISSFAGYHVATKTGHGKIVSDTDILTFKNIENMNDTAGFKPETFNPGINFMLVEFDAKKEQTTDSGIVVNTAREQSKNDTISMVGKVLKVGDVNDYGKTLQLPLTDDIVVLDGHVGDRVNDTSVNTDKEYKVVHIGDILGYIK